MRIPMNVASVVVAVALLGACAPEVKEDPAVAEMRAAAESERQMIAAVATWIEAWDTGNTDSLDAITAADFKRRAPDRNAESLEELKALIAEVRTIYPDFRITTDGLAAGPDGGFVQWTVTGTDSGSTEATGNMMNVTGISRYQFVDGKIASETVTFDTGSLLKQLTRSDMPHAKP